jgi:hypothetical protein
VSSHPVPVAFSLSPARHGWIALGIDAGGQLAEIACSHAYDPFQDLADLARVLAHGMQGCVEIDEEGRSVQIWVSREPGERIGRLRVFDPHAEEGEERPRIDAAVDVVRFARSWHDAFKASVGSYDPDHWGVRADDEPSTRILAGIDLRFIAAGIELAEEGAPTPSPQAITIPGGPNRIPADVPVPGAE